MNTARRLHLEQPGLEYSVFTMIHSQPREMVKKKKKANCLMCTLKLIKRSKSKKRCSYGKNTKMLF